MAETVIAVIDSPYRPDSVRQNETAGLHYILLTIDDDPTARELMQRFMKREGVHVETASSGEEGLAIARRLKPDAITLDVLMPGMDGWAVLAAIKADDELREIPVIMLTMVDDRNMGYAFGASDYMTKPIEREHLLAIFASLPLP